RTSERKRFAGRFFADCTGHGTIGFLAKANWEMTPKGRMGMSNMWRWEEAAEPQSFPEVPWALQLEMKDFPYPREFHGQWFWESGFDKDPLGDAEGIRDWNLRAVYGAFNAMKNGDGAAKHPNARLTWIAYIGGPRESRRLMGDVVLNQDDIVEKKDFADGCVPSTWSIDLHYPKKQYSQRYPDNPFISVAVHDRRVDREFGYPVPYRCFYSRNVPNLFMAGRCISVTHEALGTVRVMKTCGMMGEVVGKAASICVRENCDPRGVYDSHLEELLGMLELPGKAHRATVDAEFIIPDDAMKLAGPRGPMSGIDPAGLSGVVIDDRQASKVGKWTKGTGLPGFVAYGYLYSGGEGAEATFSSKAPKAGKQELRLAYGSHENRGATVPVTVSVAGAVVRQLKVDMRKPAPLEHGMISLGSFDVGAGDEVAVKVSARGASGIAHVDAVQFLPVE
ncbi:MAG: FAD-dependent oxidoreductase, partial [Verrucomicrobiales bacterium]